MDLAGGALLDLGIYSLTWVFQILYHLVPDQGAPKVMSTMTKYPKTGSDESTTIALLFPKGETHGIATTGLRVGPVKSVEYVKLRNHRFIMIPIISGLLDQLFVSKGRKEKFKSSVQHSDLRSTVSFRVATPVSSTKKRSMIFKDEECIGRQTSVRSV
jgi:hypothetical protein